MPPGFALDSTSGVISGTPTIADVGTTFEFTIQVTDANAATASKTFELEVVTVVPPVADNLALTELKGHENDGSQTLGIRGTFDFGSFADHQQAKVLIKDRRRASHPIQNIVWPRPSMTARRLARLKFGVYRPVNTG
jgi:hypothetical protein